MGNKEEIANTDLGTPEIHKTKSVMVEGGSVPIARVMNQTTIDSYLMSGLIDLQQHLDGEYLMDKAVKAGIFSKGSGWRTEIASHGKMNNVPMGMEPYRKTIRSIVKRYGDHHAYVVNEVVCHDWDVRDSDHNMLTLTESLHWIADTRIGGGRNPLSARIKPERGRG